MHSPSGKNVIGFPSIADGSVAILCCCFKLTRACLQAVLHAVSSACGFLLHLITSHRSFFFVAQRGFLRAAACDVHGAYACGRVRGCSTRRFGPFTHGDGLGDGGVGIRHHVEDTWEE
jgi:hypothetical protein